MEQNSQLLHKRKLKKNKELDECEFVEHIDSLVSDEILERENDLLTLK